MPQRRTAYGCGRATACSTGRTPATTVAAGSTWTDLDQSRGLVAPGSGLEQECVWSAEDRGHGADAERDEEHHDDGEDRAATQHPNRVAHVGEERRHRALPQRRAHLFADGGRRAEAVRVRLAERPLVSLPWRRATRSSRRGNARPRRSRPGSRRLRARCRVYRGRSFATTT